MTTRTSPPDPAATAHRLRVSDPADVLAALPALLGFTPERSLILVCLGGPVGTALGAVLRHDLILPDEFDDPYVITDAMVAAIDLFASVCARERARKAIAFVVDEASDDEYDSAAVAYEAVAEALFDRLDDVGTELVGVHSVAEIAKGRFWWSLLDDPRSGFLPDPQTSAIMAAHVAEGRQIRRSRDELAATLQRASAIERATIADHIDNARESSVLARKLATAKPDPTERSRRELNMVLAHIAVAESGQRLLAPEIAELSLALANSMVRDAMLAVAVGPYAVAAEQLWLTMARALPDPERSTAATLLGFSAYVRGDGPLAGIAFEAALDSDPVHYLARLLDGVLQTGMRPTELLPIADAGFEAARLLGVTLPPAVIA
ncbi:DUF4192 domain-containing protein [Antrihabitans stalactiti]|uniref:DUF4192 domain-containing protein n=1 Tax=Antrihabitans stalactiti TaxID=2584121 RepID=A0A848KD59_9NOCA|nr:DUF4192 domain-containing protein [Antrihabitans stalactiti]NMN94090.1 DUF4192 domain-containing protein [Antrihabitans stalactiti]